MFDPKRYPGEGKQAIISRRKAYNKAIIRRRFKGFYDPDEPNGRTKTFDASKYTQEYLRSLIPT